MKELSLLLAEHAIENNEISNSLSARMRYSNQVLEFNNTDILDRYSEQDIRFTEFIESLTTQRDRDIIYITQFFQKAYNLLFIDVMVMKRQLNEYEKSIVLNVYQALSRFEQAELLTKDLPKRIQKKYLKV